jgi:Flp pilus assembly protein TadB
MLEREVATRESDLASLQAKKRRLADLTALSTITAVLLGPAAAQPGDDNPAPGFLAGLRGGWDALVASLSVLVTVLGAVLPWLIALGLPLWALLWAFRRYRRKPAPAADPGAQPEPAETA